MCVSGYKKLKKIYLIVVRLECFSLLNLCFVVCHRTLGFQSNVKKKRENKKLNCIEVAETHVFVGPHLFQCHVFLAAPEGSVGDC